MNRFSLSALLCTALLASGAWAAAPQPSTRADQARVEAYLSNIRTLTADFHQIDASGALAEGKFYLERPGKMRWDYAPPSPILIVSDGEVITYYDSELQQVNYIPVEDSLAGFLGRKTIALDGKGMKLTAFTSRAGGIRATVVQAEKPAEGSLTLAFSDHPLTLRQMVVTDASGNATHIYLQKMQQGAPIDPAMFRFLDPRGLAPYQK